MFDFNRNEIQFTTKEKNCEQCKYYVRIDSGYGYCKRYPPKLISERRYFWQPQKFKIEYQITEWCRRACGEFILRK